MERNTDRLEEVSTATVIDQVRVIAEQWQSDRSASTLTIEDLYDDESGSQT